MIFYVCHNFWLNGLVQKPVQRPSKALTWSKDLSDAGAAAPNDLLGIKSHV